MKFTLLLSAICAVLVSSCSETIESVPNEMSANDPCIGLIERIDTGSQDKAASVLQRDEVMCLETLPNLSAEAQRDISERIIAHQYPILRDENTEAILPYVHPAAARLLQVGVLQQAASEPDALDRLQPLRQSARDAGDEFVLAALLRVEGVIHRTAENYDEAIALYLRSAEAFSTAGHPEAVPTVRFLEAIATARQSDSDAALSKFRELANQVDIPWQHRNGRRLCVATRSVLLSKANDWNEKIEAMRVEAEQNGEKVFATCLLFTQLTRSALAKDPDAPALSEKVLARIEGTPLKDLRVATLHSVGQYAYLTGDFSNAIEVFTELLDVHRLREEDQAAAVIHNDLGNIFADLGDNRRAIEAFERSLEIGKDTLSSRSVAVITSNVGFAHSGEGDHDAALKYYSKARDTAGNIPNDRLFGYLNYLEAKSLHEVGRTEEAIPLAQDAIDVILEKRDPLESAAVESWLATRYLEGGDLASAQSSLTNAAKTMSNQDEADLDALDTNAAYSFWRIEYYRNMARLHRELGDPDVALSYAERSLEISEDRFEKEKVRAAANADLQFELRERSIGMELAQREAELAKLNLSQERTRATVSYGGALLALILAVLSYLAYRSKARVAVVQRDLARTKDVYLRETHHRAKNNLQILASLFRRDALQFESSDTKGTDRKLQKEAAKRVATMGLIQDHVFYHDAGATFPIRPFVEELVALIDSGLGRDEIEVSTDIDTVDAFSQIATPLGLLISEILTNAYKHAFYQQSGRISVTLKSNGADALTLSIRDDGRGIPTLANGKGSIGQGMSLIEDLSYQLGATCRIESTAGAGVAWTITGIRHRPDDA